MISEASSVDQIRQLEAASPVLKRFLELQELVKAAEKDRPVLVHSVLKRWLGNPAAREEHDQAQREWEQRHPEAVEALRELDLIRGDVEAEFAALEAERARRQTIEQALLVLAEFPRLQGAVGASLRGKPLKDTRARADLMQFESRPALWCLLLLGGVGSGKSTAAAEHAVKTKMKWIQARETRDVVWVRAVEGSRLSGFGLEAESRLKRWRRAHLMVLDDLGAETMTPMWQQAIDDVLDHRYEHSARTVLISNLSPDDFRLRYGERLADRIRQDGSVRQTADTSFRRKP